MGYQIKNKGISLYKTVKLFLLAVFLIGTVITFNNCSVGMRAVTTNAASDGSVGNTGASGIANGATSTAQRPSYNTGNGFFVLNGKLYDPYGNEFRIRGLDRNHYDSNSAGWANTNANTVRMFIETNYGASLNTLAGVVSQQLTFKQVPIITAANSDVACGGYGAGTLTSGNSDPVLANCVIQNNWVAAASTWTQFNKDALFNLVNEWGPANSSTWATTYEAAISSMRAAGYTGPLVIDTGGSAQDEADLTQYAAQVFNSDPEKNIVFSYHMYGGTNDYSATIASVKKGNPTIVTLNGGGVCHPFMPGNPYSGPGYCPSQGYTNNYTPTTEYYISGVQGMTQLNGQQPSNQNNVGGSSGSWTITLDVDSTNWPNYSGGGTVVDYNNNYALRIARLAALSQMIGAPIIIGEFGPGHNIGPSPTTVTPNEIVSAAEANNVGWIAWAFDDNNLSGPQTNNVWFGMTYQNGIYNVSSDLTMFGQEIIEGCSNPNPGGCGCPDNTPLPSYSADVYPFTATEPTVYTITSPATKCTGMANPQYDGYGLKQLAKSATIF